MENRHFQTIPPIEQAAVRQLGFFVFGILILAAAFFYQMKMVFSDPAFHAFEILSQNNISIQANRFGAVVTQIVPLIFYRMGASLPVILIAYSCCFMLLHLLTYWLLTKYDMRAAIVVPFYYLVFSTDLFYWTISEHQQAMLYLIAWFAFLYKNKHKEIDKKFISLHIPLHLAAFVWIIFLYPSSIITILFALGYCFFATEKNNKALALLAVLALLVFVFKSQVFRHEYDAAKFGDIGRGIGLLFSKGILPSMVDFLKNCFFDYYLFVFLWLFNAGYFFSQQAKLKALFLLLYPLGLILLVQFINYNGADKFYIDNMYLPLGFMVAVPFIYEILADRKYAKFTLFVLVLLFAGRLLHLGIRSQFYQDRLNYVAHLTEVMRSQPPPNECFITTTSEIDARKLMVTWSACYETALYSALSNPEEPRTLLVVDDFNNYQNILNIRGNFAAPWGNMDMTKNPLFINHIKFKNSEYKRLFKADF